MNIILLWRLIGDFAQYGNSVQDKSLSNGIFFLQLLSAVEARVVNWNIVTKGESGMFPATLYHGLVNNRITTISFNLMERPEGKR